MEISASMVKELREKTGAGMMDCKKALNECGGNMQEAIDYLRKKGLSDAAKKAGRIAAEGLVTAYIHGGGKVGVLLEINSETDFVAKNDQFQEFCRDVALHICAANPKFVSADEVDQDLLAKEREIYTAKALESGKPANIVEKIVDGQIEKFKAGVCLLTQPFVKNPDVTVETHLKNLIAVIGENIKIRRFVRFELGEGLEKKSENFVEEVMKQVQGK